MLGICRGGVCRAMPTIPGSGAISLDQQEMKGMDLEFVGGVSGPAFTAIRAGVPALFSPAAAPADAATPTAKVPEKHTADTVYTYEEGLRLVVLEKGGVPVPPSAWRRETKEAKLTMNFQLPAAPYDMRVMVSVEDVRPAADLADTNGSATAAAAAQQPPADWMTQRRRRRVTWESPPGCPLDRAHHWRLDATTVEVRDGSSSNSSIANGSSSSSSSSAGELTEVLEVELELLPAVQTQWLSEGDETRVSAMTQHLAHNLAVLIEHIDPAAPLSTISDPPRERRPEVAAAARARCEALRREGRGLAPSSSHSSASGSEGFPGAMPINMCRRHIGEVQRGDYFISEKTDGVRYLLVAVAEPASAAGAAATGAVACVLVDRKMNCFEVDGSPLLGALLGAGTVLDGELVHNRDRGAVFMVFDMLALRTAAVLHHKFAARFQAVADHVTAPYRAALAAGGALHTSANGDSGVLQHLPLVQKRFFMRHQIADLLRCVTEAPGAGRERVYRDADGRHHKTDGVIFQPNAPYSVGAHTALLKWKWLDLASVDLRVALREGVLEVTTEARDAVPVDMTPVVRLAEQDKMRLLADLRALGVSSNHSSMISIACYCSSSCSSSVVCSSSGVCDNSTYCTCALL
jgi:mRNA capping enzyme, catalytic domain